MERTKQDEDRERVGRSNNVSVYPITFTSVIYLELDIHSLDPRGEPSK